MERRIANLACYVGRFLPWRTLSGALPYCPAQPHFPIVSPLRPLAPRCRRTSSHLYGVPLITIRRRPSHSSVALSPISSTDHATNMIFVLCCPVLSSFLHTHTSRTHISAPTVKRCCRLVIAYLPLHTNPSIRLRLSPCQCTRPVPHAPPFRFVLSHSSRPLSSHSLVHLSWASTSHFSVLNFAASYTHIRR